MRFKSRVAELQALRADVCPNLLLCLHDDELTVSDKKADHAARLSTYEAARKAVEEEQTRLEKARANGTAAQQRLGAARKALPKNKDMKLRFFNMEPPDVVRRVMCAVGVLLRIPGDFVGPAGGSQPSSPVASPLGRRGISRGGSPIRLNSPFSKSLLRTTTSTPDPHESRDEFSKVAKNQSSVSSQSLRAGVPPSPNWDSLLERGEEERKEREG
jgi:hypothetical protein